MTANYGLTSKKAVRDLPAMADHLEELRERGYTIVHGILRPDEIADLRSRLNHVYERQEAEFGRDTLQEIGELDMCRLPCAYDAELLKLASHPTILGVMGEMLGDFFILHLQNGIINRPNKPHHQHAWHRDLPYQNFAISSPLAISALVAFDPFSSETGGTLLLPFSHRMATPPSDDYTRNNCIVAEAPAGSVILFDSMLVHRAGANTSQNVRVAVDHVYTVPILKQQYDMARAFGPSAALDPAMRQLLGYTSQVAQDDREWRASRLARKRASAERVA